MADWKTKSSEEVHNNPWFSVRKDEVVRFDGKGETYFVVDRPSVVFIVPLTKDNKIYLVHTNRYTTKKSNWEFPAGSSDNQDELTAAKRELREETGLSSENWVKLGELEVAPGMTGQIAHVFAARNVKLTHENEQEEEGIDKMQIISFKSALKMVENGEIVGALTIAALILAGMKLKLTK